MYTIERNSTPSPAKSIDWFIIINVLLLNAIGLIVIRGVAAHPELREPNLFMKQLIASVIGLVVMVILMIIDYKDLKILGILVYVATFALLVLVLIIGEGKEETGTQGWIRIGRFSLQPSEPGKVAMVIALAYFFDKIRQEKRFLYYILLLGSAGLLIGLVMMQPDLGTAVVYIFIFLVMLFISGIKYRYILIGVGSTLLVLPLLWFTILTKVLNPIQIERIQSFLNPQAYKNTSAYQVLHGIRYIGTGRLTGKGIGSGLAAIYVPEAETDSIFSVIGEEMGFIGAVAVIVLFTSLLLRMLYVSRFAKDRFGSYLVIGLMSMFMFHFIENVGMNIGMLPMTGIPLPFISEGGSFIIVNYIAIGIIVSVSMRRQRPMFEV
jgi:rod shape determining protein RodA